MRRPGTMFPLLLVSLLVLAGCGGSADAPPVQGAVAERFPMTVETCGRQVTIERLPERVMAVSSQAATLVWAAGAADQIDGLFAAIRPLGPATSALADVPRITPDEPSKEVILGQEPDLLITYGLTLTPWEEVERLGIDQIVQSGQCDDPVDDGPTLDGPASFQNIYDDIELYGRIFGTENAASRTVADMRGRVAAIEERFRDAPERTAAVLQAYPDGHLAAYGPRSIGHVVLETLGLTNSFADVIEGRFIELNVEELLSRDPAVIVLAHGFNVTADEAMQQLRAIPGAERLAAVREGQIIPVEGSAILGGIQPIELLDDMAEMLAGFP